MTVFALLFALCPLFGIVAYAVWLTRQEEASEGRVWALATMLSVYLGCLASTKELSGDFLTYSQYFREASGQSLWTYVASFGKEPLFYGFTYLCHYVLMGSWKLYVVVLTSVNYLLLSYAVIRMAVHLRTSLNHVVVSLFFMAFFFQEFAAIGNMLRQALAQSVSLVFLVRWHVESKRSWWLALCALGIHTSCLPVLGVGLLPFLRRKLSVSMAVRLVLVLGVMSLVFFRLGGWLSHLPFVGYVFGRVMEGEQLLGTDAWQTEVGLQLPMLVLMMLTGVMIAFLYRRMESGTGAFVFVNLNLMLLAMMLVCEVFDMYYLQMRYFFYLYAFLNPLLVLFLHESRILYSDVRQWLMMGVMMCYFFHELSHGFFAYLPVMEALVNPLPLYLL